MRNHVLSAFFHIRNALAHGRFEIKKHGNFLYYYFEDVQRDKDGSKLTARMVLKEKTLLNWIDLIKNAKTQSINIKL